MANTRKYYQVHVILTEVEEDTESLDILETDILEEDEVKGHPNDFDTLEEAVRVYNEATGLNK